MAHWRGSLRSLCPVKLESAWQTELNAQFYRESEIVSLLLRATTWVPDLAVGYMAASWETAWFPRPVDGIADQSLAVAVDLATRAHAVHAGIRPAALLPAEVNAHDPFAMALRRIEFESGRLLQAQIILLKGPDLVPFRDAVSSALERRHAEVRKLWSEALEGVGIATPRSDEGRVMRSLDADQWSAEPARQHASTVTLSLIAC